MNRILGIKKGFIKLECVSINDMNIQVFLFTLHFHRSSFTVHPSPFTFSLFTVHFSLFTVHPSILNLISFSLCKKFFRCIRCFRWLKITISPSHYLTSFILNSQFSILNYSLFLFLSFSLCKPNLFPSL